MNEIMVNIGIVVFIIYAAFSIAYIMSAKRTSVAMRTFLEKTEGNLNVTLLELKGTLENTRKITEDVNAITSDVRQISHTVASLEDDIQNLYGYLKEGLGSTEANIAGLKAGIKTGVVTLVKNLKQGRSDDHERGT